MNIKKIIAVILALLLMMGLTACDNGVITGKGMASSSYFATQTSVYVYDDFTQEENVEKFDNMWEDVKIILKEVDESISISKKNSDVSKFNELSFGESVEISKITANVFNIAKKAYEDSDGLYDPTIYPLVDLWGFTPRFFDFNYQKEMPYDRDYIVAVIPPPSEKYIDGLLPLVDFSKVELSEKDNKYYLTKNIEDVEIDGITYSAKIDLGGIGKGYAVSLAEDIVRNYGYEYGYISSGTSSMSLCQKYGVDDGNYALAIRKPRVGKTESNQFMTLSVSDVELSSSGDYDRYYMYENDRYCHIISPLNGYPMNIGSNKGDENIITVTIMGENGAYLDGITTAVCLMDIDSGLEFLNRLGDIYVLTTEDNNGILTTYTNSEKERVDVVDEAYNIVYVK